MWSGVSGCNRHQILLSRIKPPFLAVSSQLFAGSIVILVVSSMGLKISLLRFPCIVGNCDGVVSSAPANREGAEGINKLGREPFQVSADGSIAHDIGEQSVEDFVQFMILKKIPKENFFVMHLTTLWRLYQNWRRLLSRVEPFYAVKCNPDVKMMSVLAQMGAGFDCASLEEMRLVLGLGVPSAKIIFSNPCKAPSAIAAAVDLGVDLMTFDTLCELEKIKTAGPQTRAMLRIRADDLDAQHVFGNKFGADGDEIPGLYTKAKELGIKVVGVSFHIGSRSSNPEAFSDAIALAREAFDLGLQEGFSMTILDIGGGFSVEGINGDPSTFETMARTVNAALDHHFPSDSNVKIIAEPGRYFMETCGTLVTMVISYRERTTNGVQRRDYWITDGLHGSFNPISVGLTDLKYTLLKAQTQDEGKSHPGTVFGPTGNGNDFVLKDELLPELYPGDWFLFHDMGAYTSALSSNFNGMHGTLKVHYVHNQEVDSLQEMS